MSAIAGIFHLNEEPIPCEHGNVIMRSLQKYPSDDVQTWHDKQIFLGCHAQWITPESVGEKLPFYDVESRMAITADAIIDNRDELFKKLDINMARRKQMTDSELILHSYQKWEDACTEFLIGDFAFMIWDEKKQKLFGARDFSGSRTLYYYHDGKRFVFCTVIHPFLCLPYIGVKLNETWLAENLAITGMIDTVDARTTPYQSIEQIPPAHSISISRNKIQLTQYCTLTPGKELKLKSNEEYVEAFQEVFQKAVACRLRTHRKKGSQLSGGLDSGSVVGFARKLMEPGETLHTFSYIPPADFKDFTGKQWMADETPFIKSTVNYVGGIQDHYLDFEGKSPYSEIEDMLDIMELPYKFIVNSFWLKGMFEKAYEQGIGVLLNGDRGNFTVSWGSALDYYAGLFKKLKWIRLVLELDKYSKKVGGSRLRRLPLIAKTSFPFIDQIFSEKDPYELPRIIHPAFSKRTGIFQKLKRYGIDHTGWLPNSSDNEGRRILFEKMFLWNTGNTFDTKLSLKHSLWKRDPTNDLRIYRFCLSIPEGQYVQNGLDRALIRRSTKGYLPDKVRLNQKVYGVQGADWVHRIMPYRNNIISELQNLCTDSRFLEYFDVDVIKKSLLKVRKRGNAISFMDPDCQILMRSLIIYRFLRKFDLVCNH